MRNPLVVTTVLVGLLTAGRAWAWADEGHRVVCEIAWQRLTTNARALVTELLGPGSPPKERFLESCLWADRVRETTHQDTAEYHFLNVRRGAPSVDLTRDCPAYDCVPIAIRRYLAYLVDDGANGERRRADALKFLAHFVADAHQPLHAGYLEDRGGNETLVRWRSLELEVRLHAVWDHWIIRQAGLAEDRATAALAAEISAEDAARWQDANVERWADESYHLAVENAYDLPADHVLDAAYYERAVAVVRQQLKKAGVRLAYLLNAIAAGPSEAQALMPAPTGQATPVPPRPQ